MARRTCKTTGKDIFPDAVEAQLAMADIIRSTSHHRHRKFREEPCRTYPCFSCGGWHMTSKPDHGILTGQISR